MEKGCGVSAKYLLRRGEHFFFRIHVPLDLRLWFGGRRELRKSLKVSQYNGRDGCPGAKALVRAELFRAERLFTQIRMGVGLMDAAQIKKLVDAYFTRTLADYRADAEDDRADGIIVDGEGLSLHLSDLEEAFAEGEHVKVASSTADAVLACARESGLIPSGVVLDKASHEYRVLCREALKGIIAGTRLQLEGMRGHYADDGALPGRVFDPPTPDKVAPDRPGTGGSPLSPGDRLSKLVGEFVHERAGSGRWRDRSKAEAVSALNLFIRIVGQGQSPPDRPVGELTRRDISAYRDALQRWPLHAEKKAQYRGKSAAEILKLATGGPDGPGRTISPTTINQHVGYVQSFIRWAVSSGHIEINIAEGLKLKKSKKASEERESYSTDDLKRILSSPIYRTPSGTTDLPAKQPERYWIPLIALLSGMRLNEVAQLHLGDVRVVDDIPCFDINAEGEKALKNAASKRTVSIHPTLLELGFMGYVEGLRQRGKKRLWENLTKKRNGFGHSFSRWWGRYSREHVTTNPLRVFHSFRAGFITSMLNAGVEKELVQALVGHASGSITGDRYFKGYEPRILLAAISRLSYGREVEEELRKLTPKPLL